MNQEGDPEMHETGLALLPQGTNAQTGFCPKIQSRIYGNQQNHESGKS
jgi:hypothetical protein